MIDIDAEGEAWLHLIGEGSKENLPHAPLSTTSIYLHAEEAKRARQLGKAFAIQ